MLFELNSTMLWNPIAYTSANA